MKRVYMRIIVGALLLGSCGIQAMQKNKKKPLPSDEGMAFAPGIRHALAKEKKGKKGEFLPPDEGMAFVCGMSRTCTQRKKEKKQKRREQCELGAIPDEFALAQARATFEENKRRGGWQRLDNKDEFPPPGGGEGSGSSSDENPLLTPEEAMLLAECRSGDAIPEERPQCQPVELDEVVLFTRKSLRALTKLSSYAYETLP